MIDFRFALIGFSLFLSSSYAGSLSPAPIRNSLIVYNSNIGLVHEESHLSLNKSDTTIVYGGVARSIDTDSVNVKLPNVVKLYSQQYRYDKLTQKKLLDAHIGKEVEVNNEKVTLLANDTQRSIVKTAKNNFISVDAKDIVFHSIPSELITKPSLVWNVTTPRDIKGEMSIDYIIKNISWSSNYIVNIKDERANLSGWISINNHSGKAFKDTELHVLAGDINRAKSTKPHPQMRYMKAMANSPQVLQQAHEGYHFYTVPFKVNLANNEKTQVQFISENALDVTRKYSARLANPLYLRGEIKTDVTQFIKLQGLSISLPKGVVRTYSKLEKTSILLGETNIAHTPKNEAIELKLGTNFDLKVTQTTLHRNDNKKYFNVDVNYKVQNSSDEDKKVELLVPFNKNRASKIKTKEKYNFTKGNLVTFSILVKANSSKNFQANFESKK